MVGYSTDSAIYHSFLTRVVVRASTALVANKSVNCSVVGAALATLASTRSAAERMDDRCMVAIPVNEEFNWRGEL